MSKGKVRSGDDEVSEFGEGMYDGRQADKDGKGKGTWTKVELDGEEVSTEVGNMNYVNVMMELCEENAEADRVGIWLRLYAFIVLSGVFFPRTPYGAAWSLLHYVDDVDGMGQYGSRDTRRGSPIKMGSDSPGLQASVKLIMEACMMRLSCSPSWKRAR
ncbi:hypothetical protein Cgig2_018883 [Carnegiea gigantea]|uniref:Uncharacterized protein n=1 Tax=Carnegiea gigantea TaxID=171969 RepID=A0A9Q1QEB4_9CARY|nr:hypothetical protein Cgig2_018883 [Carnegiea gigantea]